MFLGVAGIRYFSNCCIIFYLYICHNFLIGRHFGLFPLGLLLIKLL